MLRISIITITLLSWCSFNLEAFFPSEDPTEVIEWLSSESLGALEGRVWEQHVNLKEERFNRERRKALEKDLLEIQWKKLSERKALLDQEKISAKDRIINLHEKLERGEISAEEFSPQRQKLEAEIEHALEPQIKEAADQRFQCRQKIEHLRSHAKFQQSTDNPWIAQGMLDAEGRLSGHAPPIEEADTLLKNIEYLAAHINRLTNQGYLEEFTTLSEMFQKTFDGYFFLLAHVMKEKKLQEGSILNRIIIWDGIEKNFSDSRSFFNTLKHNGNDNLLALFQAQELLKFLIRQLSSKDERQTFLGKEASSESVSFEYLLNVTKELASSEEPTYKDIRLFLYQLCLLLNKNILRLLHDAQKESGEASTSQQSKVSAKTEAPVKEEAPETKLLDAPPAPKTQSLCLEEKPKDDSLALPSSNPKKSEASVNTKAPTKKEAPKKVSQVSLEAKTEGAVKKSPLTSSSKTAMWLSGGGLGVILLVKAVRWIYTKFEAQKPVAPSGEKHENETQETFLEPKKMIKDVKKPAPKMLISNPAKRKNLQILAYT